MPADNLNPITGSETTLQLLVGGVVQKKVLIESFDVNAVNQTQESRPLGNTTTYVEVIPDGWEGSFEVMVRDATMALVYDAYIAAKKARLPTSIQISQREYYKDLSSAGWTYTNVQLPEFGSSAKRGTNVSNKMKWRTGESRIPL